MVACMFASEIVLDIFDRFEQKSSTALKGYADCLSPPEPHPCRELACWAKAYAAWYTHEWPFFATTRIGAAAYEMWL
jgi:hypothetical protein